MPRDTNPGWSFVTSPDSPSVVRRERSAIEIAETFGMEFETDNLISEDIGRDDVVKNYFRATTDASIQTDVFMTSGGLILKRSSDEHALQYLAKSNFTIGTEILTGVLRSSDPNLLDLLKRFTGFLGDMGESETSLRSGIHFHISLPNPNLSMLKSIVKLANSLEILFYTIGGMGYEFRGVKNDCTYCRPITKFGPPVVNYYKGGNVQVYTTQDLLDAKNVQDFWVRYGDIPSHSDRYSPVRYSWINLFPMSYISPEYKGTLEFRVFNKTLNPHYIYATLQLCKKFTEFVVGNYRDLKVAEYLGESSIYDSFSKEKVVELFENTVRVLGIEDNIAYILYNIIKSSPVPTLSKEYVFSHILTKRPTNSYWKGSDYSPKIISEDIKKPEYVDIHRLRGEH